MSYNSELTKKDKQGVFWRWAMLPQIAWNYETMQGASVALALGPALKKIYGNNPDILKEKLHSHFKFFNTQPYMGGLVMGATLAVEESGEDTTGESATAIKTGLMGPLAGVGDSIFFVIPLTILGAISAYMALEGSAMGILISIIYGFALLTLRYFLFNMGYIQGSKFVTTLAGQLELITNAANILGLTVIGALIASTVKLYTPAVVSAGEASVEVQKIFDMMMPNFLPAAFVLFVYWLLGREKMTTVKVIAIVLIISIIGCSLNIFGVLPKQ